MPTSAMSYIKGHINRIDNKIYNYILETKQSADIDIPSREPTWYLKTDQFKGIP